MAFFSTAMQLTLRLFAGYERILFTLWHTTSTHGQKIPRFFTQEKCLWYIIKKFLSLFFRISTRLYYVYDGCKTSKRMKNFLEENAWLSYIKLTCVCVCGGEFSREIILPWCWCVEIGKWKAVKLFEIPWAFGSKALFEIWKTRWSNHWTFFYLHPK